MKTSVGDDPYEERVLAIGLRVAELRRRRGLSLDDITALSTELGHRVDPTALWRWEVGQRKPTIANLLVLADVLDVPAALLLADVSVDPPSLGP